MTITKAISEIRNQVKEQGIKLHVIFKEPGTREIRCRNGYTATVRVSKELGFIAFVYNRSNFNHLVGEGFSEERAAELSINVVGELDELCNYLCGKQFAMMN